jgi:hypothetical protein
MSEQITENAKNKHISDAFKVLKQAIQEDVEEGSLAHGWHCNIKMMCYDAILANKLVIACDIDSDSAHYEALNIGDDAAARFMKICFDAKTA